MLKSLVFLLSFLVLAQGIRIQWPWQGASKDEDGAGPLTLRKWLKEEKFHLAMQPLWHTSMLVHMSILNILKQNQLHENIASLSGASVTGLVASIWASNPGEKGYAEVFGRNMSRSDCENSCSKDEKFYTNWLESPINSEFYGMLAVIDEDEYTEYSKNTFDLLKDTVNPPTRRESYPSWLKYTFYMDLMKVEKSFDDTRVPVAMTGFSQKGADLKTVLMSKGNLHCAILGGLSTPGNTEHVKVHDDYSIIDGFMGDEHGARGYDGLDPSQRPARMLLVGVSDSPTDWRGEILDFSRLKAHAQLKQAASIIMAQRLPLDLQMSMEEGKSQRVKYKDVLLATHACWAKALDSPLQLAQPDPTHKVMSYYQKLDFARWLPNHVMADTKPWMHFKEKVLNEKSNKQYATPYADFIQKQFPTGGWHPEMWDATEAIEVEDKNHILEDPTFQRFHKRFKKTVEEMYSGEQFKEVRNTTSGSTLPEALVIEKELSQSLQAQAAVQQEQQAKDQQHLEKEQAKALENEKKEIRRRKPV